VKKNEKGALYINKITTIKYKLQTYNNMHGFYTHYKLYVDEQVLHKSGTQ
jgi:hypothetical protein